MHFFRGQKRGLSSKYVKNDIFVFFLFSSNILLHQNFELNFLKYLFDTMLKRYQKKKKEIFLSPNAFFWGKTFKK